MASGTFYPAVNGDDGTWRIGAYYNSQDVLRFGNYSNDPYNTFIRFPNVTIPQYSVITDAFIRFTCHNSASATACNVNVYFNDVDDAAAPANEAGADGLALTGAVAWNALVAWIDGNIYDTEDISTILQTIIDRGGWSSGNAVQALIKDNTSDALAARMPSAFDYLGGVEKAELHVTWNPPFFNADVTNPSMQANGYTGIYAVSLIPTQQAQGYTGIYSAPSIPMIQPEGFTGITAEPSISMPIAIVTGHDDIAHIEASITIPSMSAKLTQAKQIWGSVSIPSMVAEATERETTLANVSIPMMTAELTSGIHADLEATTPMATAEGLFSNQAEITIPMMAAELEGKVGRVVSSAVKVPMMMVEATGKTEHLVNGTVSIPMIRAKAALMTGKIITGAAEIPMMTAALTSYEDIIGDINASIPMIEPYMVGTPERFEDCVVLRYMEPR